MSPPQATLEPARAPAEAAAPAVAAVAAPAESFVPAVVVPTYHNARTLGEVLEGLGALGLPIVVVDDGCRDESPRILERWALAGAGATDCCAGWSAPRLPRRVERHPVNRGKGAALRTGFLAAAEFGATHAATIDSDGQHDAADIPGLLAAARAQPGAIVIGARPGVMPGRPARCLAGLRIANALVEYECGRRLADTQSGLRVYPLDFVTRAPCRSERFSYETETLIRAAWAGRPVIERPIRCRYFPHELRVSHWRPVVDTMRDVRLHSRMLVEAVMRG
jgi:glycosyltransferase involved in cell wall biosynthesis